MGMVQSCFNSFRTLSWFQPQLVNLESEVYEQDQPKIYSWDKKRSDHSDFIFENLEGQTVGKVPGEINGNQFIIRNCKNCSIYLFDHMNTITVDDCLHCKIFIGPTKVSLNSLR